MELLVGTDDGLFRVAGGAAKPLLHTKGRSVRCIAKTEGGTILVGYGGRGTGLFQSRDNGVSWEAVPGWPEEREVWAACVRMDGAIWLGGQPAEIWQQADGGWRPNPTLADIPERSQWTFIRPPFLAHVLGFARQDECWLAAVEQGGVLESLDDGATWNQVSPVWDTHVVVYAPGGNTLAATAGGLFLRSEKWTGPLVRGYATGLCQGADGTFYLAVRDGEDALWRSGDGGATWEALRADVPEPGHGVHALAADGDIIYHGAEDGVWRIEAGEARPLVHGLPAVRRLLVE